MWEKMVFLASIAASTILRAPHSSDPWRRRRQGLLLGISEFMAFATVEGFRPARLLWNARQDVDPGMLAAHRIVFATLSVHRFESESCDWRLIALADTAKVLGVPGCARPTRI